jgi:hypothetical protein
MTPENRREQSRVATVPKLDPPPDRAHAPEGDDKYEARWNRIQALFVDDPKRAVEVASAILRAEMERAIERLLKAQEHAASQPEGADATEELRQCLQHVRNVARELETATI